MAVQLSAYLWLRNNELSILLDPYNGSHVSEQHKKRLTEITDELDKLHLERQSERVLKPIVGPNVLISGYDRILEVSSNPQRSAELYEEMHIMFQNYLVQPRIYRELGKAFEEIGMTPKDDTAKAIEHGTVMFERIARLHRGSSDRMCWKYLRDKHQKQVH